MYWQLSNLQDIFFKLDLSKIILNFQKSEKVGGFPPMINKQWKKYVMIILYPWLLPNTKLRTETRNYQVFYKIHDYFIIQ